MILKMFLSLPFLSKINKKIIFKNYNMFYFRINLSVYKSFFYYGFCFKFYF